MLTRYYKKKLQKKALQKKACEKYLSEEERNKKRQYGLVNDVEIFQKMKNKG